MKAFFASIGRFLSKGFGFLMWLVVLWGLLNLSSVSLWLALAVTAALVVVIVRAKSKTKAKYKEAGSGVYIGI